MFFSGEGSGDETSLGTSLAGQSLPAKLLGNEANAQTLGLVWALALDLVFQLSDDLDC